MDSDSDPKDPSKQISKVLPTKFATPAEDAANLPKQEAKDYSSHLPEDSEPGRMNKPAPANAHISEKVYYFPESFNALRVEMHDHWPTLWKTVQWFMAFDAVTFIEIMDGACDCRTTFDTAKVDAICARYLDLLRKKRGLSPLSGYTS